MLQHFVSMCSERTCALGAREQRACEAQRQPARHRRHAACDTQCDQLVKGRTRTTTASTHTCSVIRVQHSRRSLTGREKTLLGVSVLVRESTAQGVDPRRQHTVARHPVGVCHSISIVGECAVQLMEVKGGGGGGAAGHQSADRVPASLKLTTIKACSHTLKGQKLYTWQRNEAAWRDFDAAEDQSPSPQPTFRE